MIERAKTRFDRLRVELKDLCTSHEDALDDRAVSYEELRRAREYLNERNMKHANNEANAVTLEREIKRLGDAKQIVFETSV